MVGEVCALACALAWAVGVCLLRRGAARVRPLPLNLYKNVFATVLLVLTMVVLGRELAPEGATSGEWGLLLVSGALGLGLGDTMFLAGLNRLGAGRAAVAECFYGPLVAVCAFVHPGLDESLGWGVGVGFVLVSAGMLVSAWEPRRAGDARGELEEGWDVLGFALALGAVAVMAVGVVLAKPVLNRHDFMWCTVTRLYGGLAVLLVVGSLSAERRAMWAMMRPSRSWWELAPAAFVATYLAMMLLFAGLKYTEATRASLINQTSTFWIALAAWPMLGERLTGPRIVAVLLGFGGALAVILGGMPGG